MIRSRTVPLVLGCCFLLGVTAASPAAAEEPAELTLERIFASTPIGGTLPRGLSWRPGHEQVVLLEQRGEGEQASEVLVAVTPAEGTRTLLLDPSNLVQEVQAVVLSGGSVFGLATADGVVTYAGKKGLLGTTVIIDHGHGIVTRYGHCSKTLKKRGDRVKRWEPIALMGNTGRSTGPHVHYEVRLNGIPVNPEKYILN